MTDDDLDRRLREAMSVAPGADLTARVRSRIAVEPVRSPAWQWRLAAAGGALAVAAVMAVVIVGRSPQLDAPFADPTMPDRANAVQAPIEPVAVVRPDIERRTVAGRAPPWPVAATRRIETPVLQFDSGEAEAFLVLLAFSRAALVGSSPEPTTVVMPVEAPPLQPLDVQPVEVAPLVLADTIVEGGPQ